MKKLTIFFAFVAFVALSLGCVAPVSASTEEEPMINLFASKSDWMQSTGNGEITFDDSGITMTPINTIGTAYVANKMGQGKISFTYQVEYAQGVDPFK